MNRLFYFLAVLGGSVLCLLLQWPWYAIAGISFLLALPFRMRRRAGFWFAFLGGVFTWGIYLTYLEFSNDGILAGRMADMFQVNSGWIMVAGSTLWGGITSGLGGWTGTNLRKALETQPGVA